MEKGIRNAGRAGFKGHGGQALWEKVAAHARAAGSVAAACRSLGISRSAYYRLRASSGAAEPRPAVPKSVEHRERILHLALENPEWGCVRIAYFLELQGIRISSPTVQKILKAENLGKARQRHAAREGRTGGEGTGRTK
jgi:hypothetical protein